MRVALLALDLATAVAWAGTRPFRYARVGKYTSFYVDPARSHLNGEEGEEVWAMGRNDYNQLGIAQNGSPNCPAPVFFPDVSSRIQVEHIAAGAFHTLFWVTDQETLVSQLFGCGRNNHGQLGTVVLPETGAVHIPFDGRLTNMAAGYAHSLMAGMAMDGITPGVYVMGWNAQGQLGLGDTEDRREPYLAWIDEVGGGTPSVAAGHDYSFILTTAKVVYAFGNNLGGQLGMAHRVSTLWPTVVTTLLPTMGVMELAAGSSHTVFSSTTGAWSTGSNFLGQLGDGTYVNRDRLVQSSVQWQAGTGVPAGGDSTCAQGVLPDDNLTQTGVLCTGSNRFGTIGMGDIWQSPRFVKVFWGAAADLAVGEYHSIIVARDGMQTFLHAVGANGWGQLGDCSTNNSRNWIVGRVFTTTSTATTTTSMTTTVTTYTGSTNTTTSSATTTTSSSSSSSSTSISNTSTSSTTTTTSSTTTTVTRRFSGILDPILDNAAVSMIVGGSIVVFVFLVACCLCCRKGAQREELEDVELPPSRASVAAASRGPPRFAELAPEGISLNQASDQSHQASDKTETFQSATSWAAPAR